MGILGTSCGKPSMDSRPYSSVVAPVVTPERSPGLPTTTMDVDVPPVMPPPIPPTSVDAVEGGPVGVVAGDGATRVEVTPEMLGFLSTALGNVPPELWELLLAQMSPVEVAGFFQSVSAQVTQTEMMRDHLAQQAQAKPAGEPILDPEPVPVPEPEPDTPDPRTHELMRDLGSEVVAEKILLEHMARASKKFADAIDPEFEKANDKWLLKSLRWLFNISPEENIKTVGLQTLVDGLIFVGSTGLDYVTGKPLMDQLEKIGFLSALGIDRTSADGKAAHDTPEYKSHIKLRILGQVIDFVTDAMMEGGINKVYEMLNRKEMKEMFGYLGYSEDEINKYMETWKNGSYVTPLAGVLGKLSTIFLPADIKNLVSSANLSAGQRILRRFPVVGRYVFSPIVDFIDGRFKKWPILKGLIPTVGGVVGLARELR